MIAGIERYFQLARAMRDEDLRGGPPAGAPRRSIWKCCFVTEQELRDMVEGMIIHVAEAKIGKKLLKKPFPVFTHEEAMKQFGADKFDMLKSEEEKKDPDLWRSPGWWIFLCSSGTKKRSAIPSRTILSRRRRRSTWRNFYERGGPGEFARPAVRPGCAMATRWPPAACASPIRWSSARSSRSWASLPSRRKSAFGHLIHAYEYAAPPHAGVAVGFDRQMTMIFAHEPNIPRSGGVPGGRRRPHLGHGRARARHRETVARSAHQAGPAEGVGRNELTQRFFCCIKFVRQPL